MRRHDRSAGVAESKAGWHTTSIEGSRPSNGCCGSVSCLFGWEQPGVHYWPCSDPVNSAYTHDSSSACVACNPMRSAVRNLRVPTGLLGRGPRAPGSAYRGTFKHVPGCDRGRAPCGKPAE